MFQISNLPTAIYLTWTQEIWRVITTIPPVYVYIVVCICVVWSEVEHDVILPLDGIGWLGHEFHAIPVMIIDGTVLCACVLVQAMEGVRHEPDVFAHGLGVESLLTEASTLQSVLIRMWLDRSGGTW